jgi:hypothetical protein
MAGVRVPLLRRHGFGCLTLPGFRRASTTGDGITRLFSPAIRPSGAKVGQTPMIPQTRCEGRARTPVAPPSQNRVAHSPVTFFIPPLRNPEPFGITNRVEDK